MGLDFCLLTSSSPPQPHAPRHTTSGFAATPGSTAPLFEQILVSYLSVLVREMFIRMFFIRTFVLDDLLKKTRELIVTYEKDPNFVAEIR